MQLDSRMANERTRYDGRERELTQSNGPSIGELFRQLGQDTQTLFRQEVALAKAEVRHAGRRVAKDATSVGIAAVLALAGIMTLCAALVILLGQALDGRYWLSALIVGALLVVIGWLMAKSAVGDLKDRPLVPKETVATLREDKEWAVREVKELKRDLTKDPTSITYQAARRPS